MKRMVFLMTVVVLSAAAIAAPARAETRPVHCEHGQSLQQAINSADPGTTLLLSGTCMGGVVIGVPGLTLQGMAGAAIDGRGKDAVTFHGTRNAELLSLTVQNGNNGVIADGGAHVMLVNTNVVSSKAMGIQLETGASAVVTGGGVSASAVNGIDLEGSASLVVTGNYSVSGNGVFGLNINTSSSLTLVQANLQVTGNILGLQVGTSSGAFIADSMTSLTVSSNATTGLTIVSGGHMVAFGGTIETAHNGIHGVSVDSKAGFDMDAASVLNSHDNGGDGLHLEETSVATLFNTPSFSGVPGTTTVNAYNNAGNGVNLITGSDMTLVHQAVVNSTANGLAGVAADNGSQVTLIGSTVSGNTGKDIVLTFGARGDISTTTFGTLSCDATVLLRGTTGVTCPH